MKRYTLSVTSPEYWSEIHDALIVDSNQDGIPDRKIICTDSKCHSPTRGTYELTDSEATEIGNHPHVKWIELSPEDNPGNYPNASHDTKRFSSNVKIYRDLVTHAPPTTNPTSAELNRTNWAVKRVGIDTNGDSWPTVTGNPAVINSNIDYSLTGKNVDIIIHDDGIFASHPEFRDGNGKSRVRDIILDGPYYIDKSYFDSNGHTFTRPDGRIGISTTSAHAWWENSSSRSGSFSSVGTVAIPNSYTETNSIGVGVGTEHNLSGGHGTACAGLAAGKNFGLAFEADLWCMSIFAPADLSTSLSYDAMKIFHENKPVNPITGVKNPTVINGSWGYQAAFLSNSTVSYKFRGSTGTFTGNASVTSQVTAMKDGLDNSVTGAYRSWSTSSRSNSVDTAGNELIESGVMYVTSAGNNNQRIGVGTDDPDRLNYMSDNYYGSTDPRPEFPSGTVPCNHRDWLHPTGIGYSSADDFHPVICVGAMDEFVNNDLSERKASYSNNGPGVDVWSPADETLTCGTTGVSNYQDFRRADVANYFDTNFNGTSAASPVVAGLVALYMEANPTATQKDLKRFIGDQGSFHVEDSLYQDEHSDDSQTNYWTGAYNLRGASRRILRDLSASDVIPSIQGATVSGVVFKQS